MTTAARPANIILVATTRPETMLGDTAVAVHPDDERYIHLHGKKVRLPLVGRLIPIIADEYSDPEKGTGAVKITPAHDFNDFEVGRRHESEGVGPINVLDAEARIELQGNLPFWDTAWPTTALTVGSQASQDLEDVDSLNGLDRSEARARVVEMMEARGFSRKSSRTRIWCRMETVRALSSSLASPINGMSRRRRWHNRRLRQCARARRDFIPKNWEKTYFDWLENIQPWCISRQLWWGHHIPAWYGRRRLAINNGPC